VKCIGQAGYLAATAGADSHNQETAAVTDEDTDTRIERGASGHEAHVFQRGREWYFAAREGDIGPFRTREQAWREARAHHSALRRD
jgi:hypothetical protein